ncbi:MAG: hypothetical protein V5A33_07360 [Halobacteriales archaeon]
MLLHLVLVLNLVLPGLGDPISLVGQDDAVTSAADLVGLLESVFDAEFEDPAAVIDLVRRGEVVELLGTVLQAVGSLSEVVVHLTVLLFVWYHLLKDGDRFVDRVGEVAPLAEATRRDLFERADELLHVVIIGNFLVDLADGVLVGLGLFVGAFRTSCSGR